MLSPSTEELEQLLEKRGRKALVMYAWRGALRALPLMGRRPIKEIWPQDTTKNCFNVLRVHWLLYEYVVGDKMIGRDILRQAADDAQSARINADAAYVYDVAAYAADVAAYATAYAAAYATAAYAYAAAKKANRADYLFLFNQANPIAACYQQPLWPDGIPDEVAKLWQNLLKDLAANQLGFLGDDINLLWRGEKLPKSAKRRVSRYIEKPSASSTASALALRQFILGKNLSENQAVRAMLIGPGGAGKTSLWQLLTARKVEDKPKVTKGVEYHDHTAIDLDKHHKALTEVKDWQELNLYLWDFGGQAIFHSLHSAFMKENCVYILVVDSRHEQAPDEWLHQIDDLTKGKAEVLLVTNFFDDVEREQNIVSLLRRFDKLLTKESFFNFSCQSADESFDLFVKKLVQTALKARHKILPCVQQAAEVLDSQFNQQEQIEIGELEEVISAEVKADEIQLALDGLNVLGRIVRLADQEYCLKPEWIINQAYCLISSPLSQSYQGMVDRHLIEKSLKSLSENQQQGRKVNASLIRQVMGFLTSLDLCLKLSDENEYVARYFIPDSAVASEPTEVKTLLLHPEALTFAYELKYLPAKIKAQLITHLFTNPDIKLDLPQGVWRDGVIVYAKNSNDLIVVEYQYRRQRIELTLLGAPDGDLPMLLGAIDSAFEKITGRQLIGYMRLENRGLDMPCSYAPIKMNDANHRLRQEKVNTIIETSKKSDPNLKIEVVTNVNTNSNNTTVTGDMNQSAAGANASNNVNISNSYNTNTQLSNDQQADLIAALNQLIQQVASQGADTAKLLLLADAKNVVEQNEQPQNEQTPSFLEKLYHAMTKVDQTGGMAEKANKYIGPLVTKGAELLGLI